MSRKGRILLVASSLTMAVVVLFVFNGKQLNDRPNFRPLLQRNGYAVALDFSDQMTGSSMNLLSMQCWGKLSHMSVVEPFIKISWLGATLQAGKPNVIDENAVKLSDIFDIDVWQQFSKEKGFSPLADWEEFLRMSPRDLIIVAQIPMGPTLDCALHKLREGVSPLVTEYNFKIVREVCFDFRRGAPSFEEYTAELFGEFSANAVTVIFRVWGGIHLDTNDPFRVVIRDSQCARNGYDVMSAARTSKFISSDVQRYINTYLNGSSTYNAVMIRLEYFFTNHNLWTKSQEEQLAAVDGCFKSIISEFSKLRSEYSLNSTLLTMDYGKHGSVKFTGEGLVTSWMDEKVKGLFNEIYGTSLSFSQWEESFETVAYKNNPGYVAQMQKELAARGQCLVLAGSGGVSSFQQQAQAMYQRYHSGSTACIAQACG